MDYNFKNTLYNLADGVVGGLRGYYTEYLVCHLNFRHAKIKENAEGLSEPDGDNLKVTLECGYFNRIDMAKAIIAEIVRGEMAKKYQKNIDEVSAVVTKIEHNYAAGSIKFGQGGQGEGGIFLAARINEQWQVVFDGNGSINCDQMRQEYQFPDEILKPNFCD